MAFLLVVRVFSRLTADSDFGVGWVEDLRGSSLSGSFGFAARRCASCSAQDDSWERGTLLGEGFEDGLQ